MGKKGMETSGRAVKAGADLDSRARLLRSALALFTRKGYAGTTVREIVADAAVTRPVLYYYFESKEGLYLALMREPLSRFLGLLGEGQGSGTTAQERIRSMSLMSYRFFRENLDAARLMYAIYYGPPQGAPFVDFDGLHSAFRSAVEALLRDGIRSGEFPEGDVGAMLWSVVGAVNVAMEVELIHPDLSLGPTGLDAVLDVIFRGIGRGSGSPASSRKGSKR